MKAFKIIFDESLPKAIKDRIFGFIIDGGGGDAWYDGLGIHEIYPTFDWDRNTKDIIVTVRIGDFEDDAEEDIDEERKDDNIN